MNIPEDPEPNPQTIRIWTGRKWINWSEWKGFSLIDPNYVPPAPEKKKTGARK